MHCVEFHTREILQHVTWRRWVYELSVSDHCIRSGRSDKAQLTIGAKSQLTPADGSADSLLSFRLTNPVRGAWFKPLSTGCFPAASRFCIPTACQFMEVRGRVSASVNWKDTDNDQAAGFWKQWWPDFCILARGRVYTSCGGCVQSGLCLSWQWISLTSDSRRVWCRVKTKFGRGCISDGWKCRSCA